MNDINPVSYKIRLEPDLTALTFSGDIEIAVEASNPVSEIFLNALGLTVRRCNVLAGNELLQCQFSVDSQKERLNICLPREMTGRITLEIVFSGEINNRMAGFYASKYYSGGTWKYNAVTQFEESDARRAFPCFDHPSKKATFVIEMVIDENLVAISNGPITGEKPMDKGKKLVIFQKTPRMSTYLLFFAVGEFEFIEDTEGDILVRAGTMPGMTEYARFGMEFGKKALKFCEDYYGLKYPFPKLDLIAIPDFAAGAMENWGAITFRENLLLHYPGITSKAGEQRICEVIAHEMAHQWFGDLVTPSDWKYLWLNESFATYFGFGVVAHYHPEWDVWEQFLYSRNGTALVRDGLEETVAIEIPGGEHVVINTSTAPIIYSKGASLLRHVVEYLGEDEFKKGLRHYLKKHEYKCASSEALWEAFEETSEKPVTTMMKSWIEQPGFPIVKAKRDAGNLSLTQSRFTYLPGESGQTWIFPVTVRVFYKNGTAKNITALLREKDSVIDIGKNAISYKINYGQAGFYRVMYDEKHNLHELGKRISGKELPPVDRWGIQNDLYALTTLGNTSLDDYLALLSYYQKEDAFLPVMSIADNLFRTYLLMDGVKQKTVASFGKSFLEKVLLNIGFEPHHDEKHTRSILRDHIMVHAALYGSETITEFAVDKFTALLKGEEIHPDIRKSVMQIGALKGNEKTFTWLDQSFKSTESEHERMNILAALGAFSEKSLIQKTLEYTLKDVPERNRFIPVAYLASNPYALSSMWEWYVSHVKDLELLHPVHYERIIESIVPVAGVGKEEDVTGFFEDYIGKNKQFRDVIELSLEKLKINSRMKNMQSG
jgi:aminopeptidase N